MSPKQIAERFTLRYDKKKSVFRIDKTHLPIIVTTRPENWVILK